MHIAMNAKDILNKTEIWETLYDPDPQDEYNFVYGSFYRPVSTVWADLPEDAICIKAKEALNFASDLPYTYIVTKEKLSDRKVHNLELELCHKR